MNLTSNYLQLASECKDLINKATHEFIASESYNSSITTGSANSYRFESSLSDTQKNNPHEYLNAFLYDKNLKWVTTKIPLRLTKNENTFSSFVSFEKFEMLRSLHFNLMPNQKIKKLSFDIYGNEEKTFLGRLFELENLPTNVVKLPFDLIHLYPYYKLKLNVELSPVAIGDNSTLVWLQVYFAENTTRAQLYLKTGEIFNN